MKKRKNVLEDRNVRLYIEIRKRGLIKKQLSQIKKSRIQILALRLFRLKLVQTKIKVKQIHLALITRIPISLKSKVFLRPNYEEVKL